MWQQPQPGTGHPGTCAGSASHSVGRSPTTLRSGPYLWGRWATHTALSTAQSGGASEGTQCVLRPYRPQGLGRTLDMGWSPLGELILSSGRWLSGVFQHPHPQGLHFVSTEQMDGL